MARHTDHTRMWKGSRWALGILLVNAVGIGIMSPEPARQAVGAIVALIILVWMSALWSRVTP